jgi:allantoin racemase
MQGHRILLINGNTTTALTERLAAQAETFLDGSASLVAMTARFGPAYIASRSAYAIAAHAVLETIRTAVAEADHPFDACLIACFGEPGIDAARELYGFPVVGMAEAAVVTALQVGRRYAIVTIGERWPSMLSDLLKVQGYQDRCSTILNLPGRALDLLDRRIDVLDQATDAVHRAASAHGADVVILGGAALSGLARDLQPRCPVPLVDSLEAACAQAEALARMRLPKASVGSFSAPSPIQEL